MNFRTVHFKNRWYYYFDGIIKFEDFNFDKILIDKKSFEILRFMIFHTKL